MDNRIKVLLVSPYSEKKVGGIGTWTKLILDYAKEDKRVELRFQNTAIWFKSNLHKNFLYRVFVGVIDTISILLKLVKNILFYKPDVVHYTSSASIALYKDRIAIFIVSRIFRKKIVMHWRFGRIPRLCELKNKEFRLLIKVIRKSSNSIIIDKRSYNCLRELGINNIEYIPNPISKYLEQTALNMQLPNQITVGRVVFVGHLTPQKGIFELVRACTKSILVTELILIGPVFENIRDELNEIAETRDNGKWLLYTGELTRENVFPYLRTANLMCLPSYTEGFPNVVLEAMANACAIVATNVGAIPEMLNNDIGICVNVKSEEELRVAIEKVILNKTLAEKMGRDGHEKVLREYILDIVFEKYYTLWNKKN